MRIFIVLLLQLICSGPTSAPHGLVKRQHVIPDDTSINTPLTSPRIHVKVSSNFMKYERWLFNLAADAESLPSVNDNINIRQNTLALSLFGIRDQCTGRYFCQIQLVNNGLSINVLGRYQNEQEKVALSDLLYHVAKVISIPKCAAGTVLTLPGIGVSRTDLCTFVAPSSIEVKVQRRGHPRNTSEMKFWIVTPGLESFAAPDCLLTSERRRAIAPQMRELETRMHARFRSIKCLVH